MTGSEKIQANDGRGITAFAQVLAMPPLSGQPVSIRPFGCDEMALDVGIGDGVSLKPLPDQPSLWFNSDGYYWFLHPFIERLWKETGQYIDLYNDASFSGASLAALERMIADAEKLVMEQPANWQVHTGTQMSPERKELYATVEKARLLALLDKWKQIVARAKAIGKPVVCFGD